MARGGSRYGAGRPASHAKAEHCLRLSIQDLTRHKLLVGGAFTWRWSNTSTGEEVGAIRIATRPDNARLIYSYNKMTINVDVQIVRTACNFGGTRSWFICPRCDRRIGVLFVRNGKFMCRHCGRIAYSCQSEDQFGRAWRVQSKLERRLGENWQRPKGMHHITRRRILDGIFACEEWRDAALSIYLQRMGMLDEL